MLRTLWEIGIKEHFYGKGRRNVKKTYYENELPKADFYSLNQRQNVGCWKFPLSHDIGSNQPASLKMRVFPVNKRMVKNNYTDSGKASMNVDPRSKQANLPKLLPTRLSQTRVLKQYNVKNTKHTIHIKKYQC